MLNASRHFCTLFDSRYLSRGLVMIDSLLNQLPNAKIFVFAFDDTCLKILKTIDRPQVVPIALADFEDPQLLAIKSGRSKGEYCWTCTPSVILYCIEKYQLHECTYIDADLYFYASPEHLFREWGDASVMITPHWYTPRYDQSTTSGIYCVQFVAFKNTTQGMTVLRWWRDQCIQWCFNRIEDGKFGDQKYLDDWTSRFRGVHVLEHRGGGMAPWNIQQYRSLANGEWHNKTTLKNYPSVFYHFHSLKILDNGKAFLGDYLLSDDVVEIFYLPYVKALLKKDEEIQSQFGMNAFRDPQKKLGLLRTLKRWLNGTLNRISLPE